MDASWIVLANSHHGRIYVRRRGVPFALVETLDHVAARERPRDLVSDRPGVRNGEGTLLHGNSTVPHTPRDEVEERRFAHLLARRLEKGRTASDFEQLVLVMPPRVYGQVFGELDTPTRNTVLLHLGQDLLRLSDVDVEERVLDAMGEPHILRPRMRTSSRP